MSAEPSISSRMAAATPWVGDKSGLGLSVTGSYAGQSTGCRRHGQFLLVLHQLGSSRVRGSSCWCESSPDLCIAAKRVVPEQSLSFQGGGYGVRHIIGNTHQSWQSLQWRGHFDGPPRPMAIIPWRAAATPLASGCCCLWLARIATALTCTGSNSRIVDATSSVSVTLAVSLAA
jgi:hypothetical protein